MDTNDKNKPQQNSYPKNVEYPAGEDIFNKDEKANYHLQDEGDPLDNGLDVPGAELDNADEQIGAEDEENNYYSLGGDNHDDPEEGG